MGCRGGVVDGGRVVGVSGGGDRQTHIHKNNTTTTKMNSHGAVRYFKRATQAGLKQNIY